MHYHTIAQYPTKTVSGRTFYDKILDSIVFIDEASQTRQVEYFSILNENTLIQNTKILLQWPEKFQNVLGACTLRPLSADRCLFSKYNLLLQILMKPSSDLVFQKYR